MCEPSGGENGVSVDMSIERGDVSWGSDWPWNGGVSWERWGARSEQFAHAICSKSSVRDQTRV